MSKIKFAVPAMILSVGLLATTASFAKPEYTKKEKKPCVYCHVTAKSKELNKVGQCYSKSKSLEGCNPEEKK